MKQLVHLVAVQRCNKFEPASRLKEGSLPCNSCLENFRVATIFREKKLQEVEELEHSVKTANKAYLEAFETTTAPSASEGDIATAVDELKGLVVTIAFNVRKLNGQCCS